jgi:hypothetical protein
MERFYNYSILQVIPDKRRGERVNIGIVIFRPDGLDIQVHESRKIRALTGESWDSYIEAFEGIVRRIDDPSMDQVSRLAMFGAVQNQFSMSKSGIFSAEDPIEYDEIVRGLMKSLVARPRSDRIREEPAIVAEISATLRQASILAKRDETLQSGKVVRGYAVEDGLEAEFAQLNSKLHVAAVLDLRADSPRIAQAALKAVTLDRAKGNDRDHVHTIGIYAVAPARRHEVRENIKLLSEYADDVVNWTDATDRRSLTRVFFDAYNHHIDSGG